MPLSEDDITLIGKKIDGTLTEAEATLFNARLSDELFRDEWNLQQGTAEALRDIFLREKLKQRLVENRNSASGKHSGRRRIRIYWTAAAVSIIAVFLFVLQLRTPTSEELFDEYYKPFSLSSSLRGEDTGLRPAYVLYEEGDYRGVLAQLLPALTDNPENEKFGMTAFVVGQCFLRVGEFDKSLSYLNAVAAGPDKVLGDHARWYMALACLKLGRTDQCRTILQELIESRSPYGARARELLNNL